MQLREDMPIPRPPIHYPERTHELSIFSDFQIHLVPHLTRLPDPGVPMLFQTPRSFEGGSQGPVNP